MRVSAELFAFISRNYFYAVASDRNFPRSLSNFSFMKRSIAAAFARRWLLGL